MNKNVIIFVLAFIAAMFVESTIFFYRQSNKLNYQKLILAKSLSEVREENKSLREKIDTTGTSLKEFKIQSYVRFQPEEK